MTKRQGLITYFADDHVSAVGGRPDPPRYVRYATWRFHPSCFQNDEEPGPQGFFYGADGRHFYARDCPRRLA